MEEKYIKAYGLTEVTQTDKHTYVGHNGNMGNTERNVRENFDAMSFSGAYDLLKAHRFARTWGSADYAFTLRVPNKVFKEIVGTL